MDLNQYSAVELDHLAKRIEVERMNRRLGNGVAVMESAQELDRDRALQNTVRSAVNEAKSLPRDSFRSGLTLDNVEDAFTYHSWDPFQQDAGTQVRDALVAAAKVILRVVPDGPDKSVALRKLRESRMDANSAITHGGRF